MDSNKRKMEINMKKIVLISMIGLLLFGCGQAQQDIKEDIQTEQTEQSDAANKDNVENQNNTDESDIDVKSNQEANDEIADEAVGIINREGYAVAIIDSPWAKDVNGEEVKTSYSIKDNTLIQTVAF